MALINANVRENITKYLNVFKLLNNLIIDNKYKVNYKLKKIYKKDGTIIERSADYEHSK